MRLRCGFGATSDSIKCCVGSQDVYVLQHGVSERAKVNRRMSIRNAACTSMNRVTSTRSRDSLINKIGTTLRGSDARSRNPGDNLHRLHHFLQLGNTISRVELAIIVHMISQSPQII
eukprot:6187942-Pleurochrysis_carterae.AAC.1